ncbi:MAG TPA: DUF6186 family protein [Acidimicrobiales bacterium]|nr:DUF6186 family protein [Acidimicrobiales bacterium]
MSRTTTLAGYAVIAAGFIALQAVSLLTGRVPTIGRMAAMVARRRVGRMLLLAGWLWVGWHLFVRSSGGG